MLIKGLSAALLAATLIAPVALAGPVDVNSADARTLARELDGIGLSKAQAIVDYRNEHGPFAGPEDLVKVKGVGARTLERIRDDLRFGKPDKGG